MAAILNDRDIVLQASTRSANTKLPDSISVPGDITGTLNGIPVQDVLSAAFASSVQPIISESGSDPVGGSHGDNHYNNVTKTMWFNINGTWTVGGTVNASQIITGILSAARIGANTITATMLNVSTLSAISANLGNVTAGNITGTANIEIDGSASFNGNTGISTDYYAVISNQQLNSKGGLKGYAGVNGVAIYGDGGTTGNRGVAGVSRTSAGIGVQAVNTSTGLALSVEGKMAITSNSLVANLNASLFNSKAATSYCQVVLGNTGTCTVSGNGFNLVSTVSGQQVRGNGSNGLIIESTSDRRLKTNIKDETLGLDFINSLKPKTYEMKDRPGFTYHGFIAQDVQLLIDGDQDALFHTNENGIHGSDAISKIPALVKAVQQLTDQIADLNQKLITVSAESVMLKSELGR